MVCGACPSRAGPAISRVAVTRQSPYRGLTELRPAGASQMQLLDFLMARGRLDAVHRDRVLALRRERGESESVIITRLGMIDERDMAQCLAEFLAIPLAAARDYPAMRCGPAGLT